MSSAPPGPIALYDPRNEHDACGVGFVVDIKGRKSHGVIEKGLQVLLNLNHRGACGCEANTGDGAGVLIQMPHEFLGKAAAEAGFDRPAPGQYGAGLVFLPPDPQRRRHCEISFERVVAEEGQQVVGWRSVPTNNAPLGATAQAAQPFIRQVFIKRNPALKDEMAFERKLYVIRKRAVEIIRNSGLKDTHYWYIPSLSHK